MKSFMCWFVRLAAMMQPVQPPTATATQTKAQQLTLLANSILFEDARFVVINKPSGMAVHGGSGKSYGVIEGLRALRPDAPYLELAHRLDKDTSGCLLIAKRRSALRAFQKQQEQGSVHKHYLALLQGKWVGGKRKIVAPLLKTTQPSGERKVLVDKSGKYAVSLFTPVSVFEHASLMRIKIITGRTHQIRVHAQYIGHPLAGDHKYGDETFNQLMAAHGLSRLFLHAQALRFTLPELPTYDMQAPLPVALEQVLSRL